MKKIAVLSDIHCNKMLLDKVLSSIDVDDYIFCGDYVTDGFHNNEILNTIKLLSTKVVAGNREINLLSLNDSETHPRFTSMFLAKNQLTDENLKYIESLPIFDIFSLYGKRICVSHGTPYNVGEIIDQNSFDIFDKLVRDYKCDIYLFGHRHFSYDVVYKDKWFINSGAINLPFKSCLNSSFGILSVDDYGTFTYKKYSLDFKKEDILNYYIDSEYFDQCPEWCNLLIYSNLYGGDYCRLFIEYLISLNRLNDALLWIESYNEFMKINNLRILSKVK